MINKDQEPRIGETIEVRPQHLFATQSWISPEKVSRVAEIEVFTARGYVVDSSSKPKFVLGDGHTRALAAWEKGERVLFTIEDHLPAGKRYFPLSRLRNQYADLFQV